MFPISYISLQSDVPVFQAEVNDRNYSLLQKELTRSKISRLACGCLKKLALKYYSKDVSLEVAKKYNDFWASEEDADAALLKKHFVQQQHAIRTPDGATLEAVIYRHKECDANTPTVIYSNGLGQVQEVGSIHEHMKQNIGQRPCNFVTYNYRSITSQRHFNSTKDFIVDCESVLQLVENQLQTSLSEIHFYGRSMGGGVAVKTQALDARLTGVNINESSFSSLKKVIRNLSCNLAGWLNDKLDFGMEVTDDFRRLNARRKIVMTHPNDNVIKYPGSLEVAVRGDGDERTQFIQLRLKDDFVPNDTIHNLPIEVFQDIDSGKSPIELVGNAIYGVK